MLPVVMVSSYKTTNTNNNNNNVKTTSMKTDEPDPALPNGGAL